MRAVLVLVSLAAGYVAAQDFGTVAACGQTCFTNMKGKIGGCAADNQKCHCDVPDYRNGLRDCVAQSCPAADIPLVQNSLAAYVNGVCNAAAAAPPAAGAPSTSAAPASATATSSPAPPPPPATPSAPSTSTPAPAPTTSAQTSTPSAPAPAPTTSETRTSSVAASATSTSSSHSSTGSASSSASSSSASSSATSAAAAGGASDSKHDSLSGATVAGIAIGSSAIGIALIGVLVCVFLHKRNKRRPAADGNDYGLNISQPMPGSGRSYAGDHHNEKYEMSSSLDDFKSRRYEDMLPRQTPRTMV
ncbi:hypothetical protein MAPG_02776 [Magnaporthiopsis poae ATCC 64411]|uniref:CFEM domain-containing protein n=1 Tax=Magnaporthiopsis poae (strain ATCC 64411 / 73-15) TaxID=644358 RepID=A0A0C4DS99_MAGP6|nr:hypothetical protein MAPG_02776 [Magnaporthiopsis poae ATCC 64411]